MAAVGGGTLRRTAWLASLLVLVCGYGREIAAAAADSSSATFGYHWLRLDGEASLPAWYSSVLMLLSALLMLLVSRHGGGSDGRLNRQWAVLGGLFILLSADEAVALHEQLSLPLQQLLHTGGPFFFGWVVAGLGAVMLLGLAYLPFLLRVARRTAVGLVLAGALYVAGALGLEMFGGYVYERFGPSPYYVFITVCEETLEILGLTVLFNVMVAHAAAVLPPLRLGGSPPAGP